MSRLKSRGVAFLTVLIMSVLVLMMISAALVLLPSGRAYGAATQQTQRAKAAAQAGIEYAYTKLHDDINWRADGNAVMVDIPNEMWVREDHGNLIGILYAPNGTRSMFRLRFNHQNNMDSPTENLPDPAADMAIPHKFVSVNNLASFSSAPLYRATGTGASVPSTAAQTADVPGSTAVLYAEGLSGPALRNITPTDLTPDPTAGAVTSKIVEAYIGNDAEAFGHSVMYGADDVEFDLTGKLAMVSIDGTATSQAATLASMRVNSTDPNPVTMTNGGDVYVEPNVGRFLVNGADSTAPAATQQDTSSTFVQLGWGDISQPGTTDPRMRAGTYQWQDTNPPSLAYYAEDYDPATFPTTAPVQTNLQPSQLTDDGTGIAMDNLNLRLDISKNIQVEASGGATGLAIVPDANIMASTGDRPKLRLVAASPTAPAPIIASDGNIHFKGAIAGQGSVTAQGNITLQGTSVMESNPDNEVALFSKQDINIEAIPVEVLPKLGGQGQGAAAMLPGATGVPAAAANGTTLLAPTASAQASAPASSGTLVPPAAPPLVTPASSGIPSGSLPVLPSVVAPPSMTAAAVPASSVVSGVFATTASAAPGAPAIPGTVTGMMASTTAVAPPAPAAPGAPAPAAPAPPAPAAPGAPGAPTPLAPVAPGGPNGASPAVPAPAAPAPPAPAAPGAPGAPPVAPVPAAPAAPAVAVPAVAPATPAPTTTGPGTTSVASAPAPVPAAPITPAAPVPVAPVSTPGTPAPGAPGSAIVAGGFTVGTQYWNGVIGGQEWGGGGSPIWLGPDQGFGLSTPEDVAFVGVVYAQGNFNVNLTPPNSTNRGNFLMRGVLVAYGGDYEPGSANAPGSTAGKGQIDFEAANVGLTHDSSYLSRLTNPAPPPILRVVSWRSF